MERTYTLEDAKEVAEQAGLPNLAVRVQKAMDEGWDVITLEAIANPDGTFDIGARAPSGVMVAWMLPDYLASRVAVDGGEYAGDLHVTLAYLGDAEALSLDAQRKLVGVVGEVAARHTWLEGWIGGTGRFINGEDKDPFWVGVDIPGLAALRQDLVTALTDAGLPPNGIGDAKGEYTPHITVAWIPKGQDDPPLTFAINEVTLDALTVAVGPNRFVLPLTARPDDYTYPQQNGWIPQILNKSLETVEEKRFTLAPWYIPERLDAHGEWSDQEELEKSFNAYMQDPDKGIRLQHNPDIVAGRRITGVVWPYPVTTTLRKADGTETEHTFPAGTPYLGVEWEEWAWPLIKAGKIRGYSIGGTSKRLEVDLPGEP